MKPKLMYRNYHFDAKVTVSPDLDKWFQTKGRQIERSFILSLQQSIDHAKKRDFPLTRIHVEGLMNYCRFHKAE